MRVDADIIIVSLLANNRSLGLSFPLALLYLQELEEKTRLAVLPNFNEESFDRVMDLVKKRWDGENVSELFNFLDPRLNYPMKLLKEMGITKLLNI